MTENVGILKRLQISGLFKKISGNFDFCRFRMSDNLWNSFFLYMVIYGKLKILEISGNVWESGISANFCCAVFARIESSCLISQERKGRSEENPQDAKCCLRCMAAASLIWPLRRFVLHRWRFTIIYRKVKEFWA